MVGCKWIQIRQGDSGVTGQDVSVGLAVVGDGDTVNDGSDGVMVERVSWWVGNTMWCVGVFSAVGTGEVRP